MYLRLFMMIVAVVLSACGLLDETTGGGSSGSSGGSVSGETARVVRVIDGDTIVVNLNGVEENVRYVGINTPERDEACYRDATQANADFVEGQTVTLVRDRSDRDRYDRLLRYIYVGDTFVNRELVVRGYAEAVLYDPDDRHFSAFSNLEQEAARAGRGCHPTGIFDDGTDTR